MKVIEKWEAEILEEMFREIGDQWQEETAHPQGED